MTGLDRPHEAPEPLRREDLKVGMRIMLPDGQMHGVVTIVTEEELGVLFDGTRSPMEYYWANYRDFLVAEKV